MQLICPIVCFCVPPQCGRGRHLPMGPPNHTAAQGRLNYKQALHAPQQGAGIYSREASVVSGCPSVKLVSCSHEEEGNMDATSE